MLWPCIREFVDCTTK